MATQKWIAGTVGLTWANVMTTELNSLANGSMAIASSALDNSTNLDQYADFSIVCNTGGTIIVPAGQPYMGIYLYPLNGDGSTYGDGQSGANAPGSSYWVGNISIRPSATYAPSGTLRGVLLPPGQFKPVVYNQFGVALNASTNVLKWRTYNNSVA
jgi:hypothetical protein